MIEFGHGTHRGLRRKINEDTYYADPGSGLFLVAEGMGGHDRGDRAAAAVRDCVIAEIERGCSLQHAMREAAGCVTKACPRAHASAVPVGATLATLHLSDTGFEIAWVGDSRIYVWHVTGWHELSREPGDLAPLVDAGLVRAPTPDDGQAASTPRRRRLSRTQALGITPPGDLDVRVLHGRHVAGMRFLICSDGLDEQVSGTSMRTLIERDELGAQECVDQLIRQALDVGGRDNLTAILVRIS